MREEHFSTFVSQPQSRSIIAGLGISRATPTHPPPPCRASSCFRVLILRHRAFGQHFIFRGQAWQVVSETFGIWQRPCLGFTRSDRISAEKLLERLTFLDRCTGCSRSHSKSVADHVPSGPLCFVQHAECGVYVAIK